jgi:hypothetical protein
LEDRSGPAGALAQRNRLARTGRLEGNDLLPVELHHAFGQPGERHPLLLCGHLKRKIAQRMQYRELVRRGVPAVAQKVLQSLEQEEVTVGLLR